MKVHIKLFMLAILDLQTEEKRRKISSLFIAAKERLNASAVFGNTDFIATTKCIGNINRLYSFKSKVSQG